MRNPKFKLDDQVVLRDDTHTMFIEIVNKDKNGDFDGTYKCIWKTKSGDSGSKNYREEILSKYQAPQPPPSPYDLGKMKIM